MNEAILLVDDDVRVVSALQRSLYRTYRIEIAAGAQDALDAIGKNSYAVVVSDLQMPGMNGVELLTHVKRLSPGTVRILLTGQADLDAAIAAVNEGNVFRFLTKPCPRRSSARPWTPLWNNTGCRWRRRKSCRKRSWGPWPFSSKSSAPFSPSHLNGVPHPATRASAGRRTGCAGLLGIRGRGHALPDRMHLGRSQSVEEALCRRGTRRGRSQTPPGACFRGPKLLHKVPRLQAVAQMIERQSGLAKLFHLRPQGSSDRHGRPNAACNARVHPEKQREQRNDHGAARSPPSPV